MKIAIPLSLIVVFSMIACTKPKLPVQATLPTENAPALQLKLDGFTDVDTAFIKNDPQVDFVVSGYCSWFLIRYCAIKPVRDSSFGDIPGM